MAKPLSEAEARYIHQLPSAYNHGNVREKPEPPINLCKDWYRRDSGSERTIIRHETACPCCGLAMNVETHIYPGRGRIVEISQINPKTGEWDVLATRIFREDGTEITEMEKSASHAEPGEATILLVLGDLVCFIDEMDEPPEWTEEMVNLLIRYAQTRGIDRDRFVSAVLTAEE